jgi:hypothetical protein
MPQAADLRADACGSAFEVLVQAVVVADSILKEKRRRPHLTGMIAAFDEVGVLLWVAHRFPSLHSNDWQPGPDANNRCPEFT